MKVVKAGLTLLYKLRFNKYVISMYVKVKLLKSLAFQFLFSKIVLVLVLWSTYPKCDRRNQKQVLIQKQKRVYLSVQWLIKNATMKLKIKFVNLIIFGKMGSQLLLGMPRVLGLYSATSPSTRTRHIWSWILGEYSACRPSIFPLFFSKLRILVNK
jgi:hypothetical protein